jgi:ABC-2 type transport system ATP-binding protein
MVNTAIIAEGLVKRFGRAEALAGLDLEVGAGTVCGLLGPNGAGKSTTVGILATLTRADEGRARVAGFDVAAQPTQVRRRIGLVGQHAAVDEVLDGRENLELFGRLFHLRPREARVRAGELLEQFGLGDAGDRPVARYSGGMRRRLDLAAALILAPEVLFLDEPTTGLDPRGRAEVWRAVRLLAASGTSVLLTTQDLREADELADRITVLDAGRRIAEGTPDDLKARMSADRLDVVVAAAADLPRAAAIVGRAAGAREEVDEGRLRISAPAADRVAALTEVVQGLEAAGIGAADIAVRRPTLDEVFLELTARPVPQAEVAA